MILRRMLFGLLWGWWLIIFTSSSKNICYPALGAERRLVASALNWFILPASWPGMPSKSACSWLASRMIYCAFLMRREGAALNYVAHNQDSSSVFRSFAQSYLRLYGKALSGSHILAAFRQFLARFYARSPTRAGVSTTFLWKIYRIAAFWKTVAGFFRGIYFRCRMLGFTFIDVSIIEEYI